MITPRYGFKSIMIIEAIVQVLGLNVKEINDCSVDMEKDEKLMDFEQKGDIATEEEVNKKLEKLSKLKHEISISGVGLKIRIENDIIKIDISEIDDKTNAKQKETATNE